MTIACTTSVSTRGTEVSPPRLAGVVLAHDPIDLAAPEGEIYVIVGEMAPAFAAASRFWRCVVGSELS